MDLRYLELTNPVRRWEPRYFSRVVRHFGLVRDASSSLDVKVPGRGLTLILLATSDGLAGPPCNLSSGNLFLRLFVG